MWCAADPADDTDSTDAFPFGVFFQEVCAMQKLYNWLDREDGQTMAEYGVVLAVITIAVFGALALLAGNITNALTRVAGYIT
jgi:Flp pilus assembly pilin Flp